MRSKMLNENPHLIKFFSVFLLFFFSLSLSFVSNYLYFQMKSNRRKNKKKTRIPTEFTAIYLLKIGFPSGDFLLRAKVSLRG